MYACDDIAVDVRVARTISHRVAALLAIDAPIVTGMSVDALTGGHSR